MKELTKRLAKKYRVILVDEYRTSKLCIGCGNVLKHPKTPFHEKQRKKRRKGEETEEKANHKRQHGVSYCSEKQCIEARRFKDRDVDAAYKIGARFIVKQQSQPLGPWDRNVKADDIANLVAVPFTGLRDMLIKIGGKEANAHSIDTPFTAE